MPFAGSSHHRPDLGLLVAGPEHRQADREVRLGAARVGASRPGVFQADEGAPAPRVWRGRWGRGMTRTGAHGWRRPRKPARTGKGRPARRCGARLPKVVTSSKQTSGSRSVTPILRERFARGEHNLAVLALTRRSSVASPYQRSMGSPERGEGPCNDDHPSREGAATHQPSPAHGGAAKSLFCG
jgi:hypothetical protein